MRPAKQNAPSPGCLLTEALPVHAHTHTHTHNTPALDAVWKLYCREAAVVDAAADSCDSPRAPREGKEEEGGGR